MILGILAPPLFDCYDTNVFHKKGNTNILDLN